jgi:hypothetical protein
MNLAELNRRVTDAITVAENIPKGSPESWTAFREVSMLEEEIARLTSADDVEGEIARLGAVAAALSASEPLRAVQIGQMYLAEDLADDVKSKLTAMLDDANETINTLAADLTVHPVKFTLEAA